MTQEQGRRTMARRIALVLLVLSGVAYLANTGTQLARGSSFVAVVTSMNILSLAVLVALCAASYVLTFTRGVGIAQSFQLVLFFLVAYAMLVFADPNLTFAVGSFFILALFLGSRYGFLDRRPALKGIVLTALLVPAATINMAIRGPSSSFALVGSVVFLAVYGLLWYFVAEQEIRDLLARSRAAEQSLRRHKKDIDIGRSAIGAFHGMSGRMQAMENAIAAIEKGKAGKEATARLREAQRGVAEILANIKLAVVHQSTEERTRVRVGDVLKGLLETFRAECDAAGRRIEIGLAVGEDFEMTGRPVDLYMMFENVARNAVEAGAARLEVTAGPERTVVFHNDGPPIPECAACPHHECMSCPLFREGRTGKPGGSGIGMVYVRDTVAAYGALRITSSAEGTDVAFKFMAS
jgi:signal transduction histidine kinase